MYVGRPQPHKNLWRLIEAFRILKKDHPSLVLDLIGKKDAMYDLIEARVKRGGIQDVYFAGFVTDNNLRWMYEHCQAYVFPSLSEGFGLPAVEARLHGAPLVASNASCIPEVNGDGAHYFDPFNVQDITRAINDVLTQPQLRKNLVARGKEQAATYSWERMAKQTLGVFKKALGE